MNTIEKWAGFIVYGLLIYIYAATSLTVVSSAMSIKAARPKFKIIRYWGTACNIYHVNNYDLSPGKLKLINPATNRELIICGNFDIETDY